MLRGKPMSWRFVRNILIAFLPSAILGFLLINKIEALLGNAMIVAGRPDPRRHRDPRRSSNWPSRRRHRRGRRNAGRRRVLGDRPHPVPVDDPGVSRSGATIMGALALGVERRTAAEFSFFLAIPTMLGATTLELVKHHEALMAGAERGRLRHGRGRLRRQLRGRDRGREGVRPLHLAPRLRAVRLVPDRRRRGRARLADDALIYDVQLRRIFSLCVKC